MKDTFQKKYVLLVSNMYPSVENPEYGVFVKNIEALMSSRGHITKDRVTISKQQNVPRKIIAYALLYLKSFVYSIKGDYDYIYVHYSSLSSLGIILASYFKKANIVVNAHGGDCIKQPGVSSVAWKTRKILCTWMFRRATIIIAPSRYFSKLISFIYQLDEKKIIVSPSGGVNTNLFSQVSSLNNHREFTFGYVGRLAPGKGVRTLILAYSILDKKIRQNNKLIIVGGGKCKNRLVSLVEELNIQENIEFSGRASQENLPKLIRKFSCLVFPTEMSESLGLVGLEAMAMKCNIISAKIGGPEEYIENNISGMFFQPGNWSDLAEKLEQYLSLSPNEKEEHARAACQTALTYDSELVADKLHCALTMRLGW